MNLLVFLHGVVILEQLPTYAAPEPLLRMVGRDMTLKLGVLIKQRGAESARERIVHVMLRLQMDIQVKDAGEFRAAELTLVFTEHLVAVVVDDVVGVHQADVKGDGLHPDVSHLTLLKDVPHPRAVLRVLLILTLL